MKSVIIVLLTVLSVLAQAQWVITKTVTENFSTPSEIASAKLKYGPGSNSKLQNADWASMETLAVQNYTWNWLGASGCPSGFKVAPLTDMSFSYSVRVESEIQIQLLLGDLELSNPDAGDINCVLIQY